MKVLERTALQFMEELQKKYFEDRDIEGLMAMADDRIHWVGVSDICGHGKQRALQALLRERERYPDGFVIVDAQYDADMITEDLCSLQGRIRAREKDALPEFPDLILRISATVRETPRGMRLAQLHLSTPVPEERARLVPRLLTQESTEPLRRLLTEKSNQLAEKAAGLDALMNNIPGGVIQCDDSPQLRLLQLSGGFLDLFGYTREEIAENFGDAYSRMILPEDLGAIRDAVREETALGGVREAEYRARRKDGSVIWILDRGQLVVGPDGKRTLYGILTDITRTRKAQEALRLSLERHQIILDQTADIIFEWDIARDTVICSGNWEKKFGYAPVNTGHEFRSLRHIHPDDTYLFQGMIRKITAGIPYCEAEFRAEVGEGRYAWRRVRVSLQLDGEGQPIKAVGVIIDIEQEKREAQKLRDKAERDALTGLYNKGAVKALIEEYMDIRIGECALMILDVDNFKQVNDQLGHLSGDVLLSDISQILQKQFRSMDIVGRIGGDEFLVLMRDIPDEKIVARKARALLEAFRNLAGRGCPVSCSIGVAIGPRDGTDYTALYRNADHALYQAKGKGKNASAFYSPGDLSFPEAQPPETTRIDSEREGGAINNRLVEYIFQTLYEAVDEEEAMPRILEIIGKQYHVSRSYIFEEAEDGRTVSNTFEWCGPDVKPKREAFQRMRCKGPGNCYGKFNADGVFYCRDLNDLPPERRNKLEAHGVRSILQCVMRDKGEVRGFLGFDECRNQRLWNSEEVQTLSLIAEVAGVFLIKNRVQRRMALALKSMELVLDSQDALIYVVGREDHRLLYANRKTRTMVPNCTVGTVCYRSFFRRDTPCPGCPALGDGPSREVFYALPDAGTADAAMTEISWPGEGKACLMVCRFRADGAQPRETEKNP